MTEQIDFRLKAEFLYVELVNCLKECGINFKVTDIMISDCSVIILTGTSDSIYITLSQIDEFIGWQVTRASTNKIDYEVILSAFKTEFDVISGATTNQEAVKATITTLINCRLKHYYGD